MNYYLELAKKDLIEKFKSEFEKGAFFLRNDGKITQTTRLMHSTPWIHTRRAPNRNCGLYHTYFEKLKGMIHSTCQSCWKVVVAPRTLIELHKLLELQKVLNIPSKCGIEKRDTVGRLYGGYFYNDSLEEGKECYKIVRSNVDLNLSPEVSVILKRGCTEFELGTGPSDKWEVTEEQKALEYLLLDLVAVDINLSPQPEHLKDSIFRTWIHWAYSNGDPTYLEYTGGPLFRPPVTYHEEVDNGKEEKHSVAGSEQQDSSVGDIEGKQKTRTKKGKG